MKSELEPLSAPVSRGPRFSWPGIALLLVLAAGASTFFLGSEKKGPPAAAATPTLYRPPEIPPLKAMPPRTAVPPARPPAAKAPAVPPAVRRERAQQLVAEIHDLSGRAAEAQEQARGGLIVTLQKFHRSAGNLRSAYAASGTEIDAKSLRAQVEMLILDSRDIDRRAAALGPDAAGHWQAIGRRLGELRPLV